MLLKMTDVAFTPTGLRHIDFAVAEGEIVAIVGPNGAGKTTLLRLILGMRQPTRGVIELFSHRPWKHVGFLLEHAVGYPELTVQQNLLLSGMLYQTDERIDVTAQEEYWGLQSCAGKKFRHLSSGLKQRVALARAFQHRPKLILLDEPTNALDPFGVITLRNAALDASNSGAGVVICSHHLDEVARIAHRILVLNRGRFIGELEIDQPDLERAFFRKVYDDEYSTQD